MSRSKIPRRKMRELKRMAGKAKRTVQTYRYTSGFIAWLIAGIIDGFAKSFIDLNDVLRKPLEWLGRWHPTTEFLRWIEFAVLAAVYLGTFWFVWNLVQKAWGHKNSGLIYPKILYEDEVAAAAHAVDYPTDIGEEQVRERVENLMYSIAETVATAVGVPPKYYRSYFVVGMGDDTAISGFRLGRQFQLAEKHQRPIDDILTNDAEPMARMYARKKTVSVMRDVQEEFPDSDIRQMIMVRNPGKFRMCFLMAVLDPNAEIDEHDETFLQVSYIIRSLGFMDNLVNYVLQYDGEEEDE